MTVKIKLNLLLILFFYGFVFSQNKERTILGQLKEMDSKTTIPYATIVILDGFTKKVVQGTTTDENGIFRITTSKTDFLIQISFMGYKTRFLENFDTSKSLIDLGIILLKENREALDSVELRANISKTQFKLDKKVFNVGKDIASTGMSALEVLNNVPSVNVNIEGDISLRGSSGVQILLDGKPSVLTESGGNALGTITADMIKSIEVITNPSAKYDAEGTAGILNIILKKEEKKGLNGSVSVNTGIPDNHSVGVSMNKRTQKFNLFTQFGGGYKSYPRYNKRINTNKINNSKLESEGTSYRNEVFYNLILGTDYHIDDYNVLTLSGNIAYEIESQPSETNFSAYADDLLESEWIRTEVTEAINPKWQYELNYSKAFKNDEEHTLIFSSLGRFFGKELTSEFSNTPISDANPNQLTDTQYQQADYTFKLDYKNPISEQVELEIGGQYVINEVGNDYQVKNFDRENQEFVVDPTLTNIFDYNQKVLGVYGTVSYENKNWGVKVGTRLENTDLIITNRGSEGRQQYNSLFPSAHTSYKILENFSLQAGYSKRIYRPRLWDLNPFISIRDNYNIRAGNPDLLPEFTDAYELTSIYKIGKANLSTSLYHKYTTDLQESITIFEDNITTTTPFNIGTRRSTGLEVNGKYSPLQWMTINGDLNWNYFNRNGAYLGTNYSFSNKNWSTRVNTKLSFSRDVDMEITGNYRSSNQTLQGERAGYAFLDLGLRKKILMGKAVVNFAVRDVFETRIFENIINNVNRYNYSFGQRGRFISLGFSYGFGKGEAMTYAGKSR